MVPRKVLGSPERTFWIQHSLTNSTQLTPIVQLPGVEVDHHDAGVGPQERAVERGVLSRIGQTLPSVNHNNPIHLSTNHEHLHRHRHHSQLKSTRHSSLTIWSRRHYVDSTPASFSSWVSTLPYLPVTPYLLCLLLVFSSPARSSVSVVSVLQLCFAIAAAHHICGWEDIIGYSSTHSQDDLWRHPLTWSLHSSSCLINILVLLLTTVSRSICYSFIINIINKWIECDAYLSVMKLTTRYR